MGFFKVLFASKKKLIEENIALHKNLLRTQDRVRFEIEQTHYWMERYNTKDVVVEQSVKRYEQEVVHLKDIIQEKNLVIDRLLEKNKEQS